MMRIVALLAFRNEALVLRRTLSHLYSQGIETCLIDNDSTDSSLKIAQSFYGKGVFRIERLPYKDCFKLLDVLVFKEKLVQEIDADWFIHHDADEIRETPWQDSTLKQGIELVDRQGYNAINFDEFVFMPTSSDEAFEETDFVETMRHYYYFSPNSLHRVNAWKNIGQPVNLHQHAGHQVVFDGRNIFPQKFILRHYIILSANYASQKYEKRVYSQEAIDKFGWHGARARFSKDKLNLPDKKRLKEINDNGRWDVSDPWKKHDVFGE
jgi:glycosyltransferase involved in cell wall biosynthesis